ncbi:hypothetical protein XENTR_v10017683 [Xenopus tropicalis]|nr:hypothetical protein XENTR_v10017683 [Xenopus tropicalis]
MNEMLQCANVNNIFRESASGGMCSVPRGNIMEQKDCKMGFEINFRYSLQQSVTSWRNDISWVVIGVGTPRCIWELQSHSRRLVHLVRSSRNGTMPHMTSLLVNFIGTT